MDALRLMTETPTRNHDEIEKLLSCPICLEVFNKPVVILPCQHNLCRQCAQDMYQNRGTPMGSGGRFKCPSCRHDVVLDRHGVYGLQRNLLVENIIDMYQSEGRKTIIRKPEKIVTCDEHEDERVNIYCVTCQKPTCSLCKVFGDHQECDVAPMEKIYKEQKKEISDALAALVTGNTKLQEIISQTEELRRSMEINGKKIQLEVTKAFDKLYSLIEERKKDMKNKVEVDLQERSQVLKAMLTNFKHQFETGNNLKTASLKLIDERNIPLFLKLSRDMIAKIHEAASSSEDRKPPLKIQNMGDFHVNFHFQNEILSKLDFTPLAEDEVSDVGLSYNTITDESNPLFGPHCDVILEENSDEDTASGSDKEMNALLKTSADLSKTTDEENSGTEAVIWENTVDLNKGKWYDMYVRQLPSPTSLSGFSAPMESSVHMKVIIPNEDEEDLKKDNSNLPESVTSVETDDLDSEIEQLLAPRRRRWTSKYNFYSSPDLSPRTSPTRYGTRVQTMSGKSPSPLSSPLLYQRHRGIRNTSPPSSLPPLSSTLSSSILSRQTDNLQLQSTSSKEEPSDRSVSTQRNKPTKRSKSPYFSDRGGGSPDESSESSTSNAASTRRPRMYCTHKRRTWSHLLDK